MKKIGFRSVFNCQEKGNYKFSEEDQLLSKAAFIQVSKLLLYTRQVFNKNNFYLDRDIIIGEPFSCFFWHGAWLPGDYNSAAIA